MFNGKTLVTLPNTQSVAISRNNYGVQTYDNCNGNLDKFVIAMLLVISNLFFQPTKRLCIMLPASFSGHRQVG